MIYLFTQVILVLKIKGSFVELKNQFDRFWRNILTFKISKLRKSHETVMTFYPRSNQIIKNKNMHFTKEMEFSIKDFFSKCDQIGRKLLIWSHLLKKSLMKNFIFCAVMSAILIKPFYPQVMNNFVEVLNKKLRGNKEKAFFGESWTHLFRY